MSTFFRASFVRSLSVACLSLGLIFAGVVINSAPVSAQTASSTPPSSIGAGNIRGARGLINPLGNRTPQRIIGGAVAWLGGLAGSLFLLYLLWGGIEWMTAGGSDKKVQAAQQKIVAATTGIVIVLFSYMAVAAVIGLVK